jgi:putative NADH-flavin reductase
VHAGYGERSAGNLKGVGRRSMKVLIIGATNGIGRCLTDQSVDVGEQVTVLVRNPSRFPNPRPNLRVIRGDILDPSRVEEAVKGQEAVCIVIGIPPTRKPVNVFSQGARNVLDAMKKSGVDRLVCVTGIGAGDSRGHGGFLYDRIVQPLLLKTNYTDKEKQEEIVRASGAVWTVVRPGFLTNGPRTGRYRVITDMTGVRARKISRADVADYLLKEMKTGADVGKTIFIDSLCFDTCRLTTACS